MDLYIGLMSGTSADGIDAALVDFSQEQPQLKGTHYTPYDKTLRSKILDLCQPGENEIQRLGELDVELGNAFAKAAQELLMQLSISPTDVKAIGSHGQTIRHSPKQPNRFTLQIGDPNTIAAKTGITTVADFRRRDIACGGQGAPLVPAFHQHVFTSSERSRAVVNIGGIANVTLLPHTDCATVIGFDTGPGNVLMDAWIYLHQQSTHDDNGNWAASGKLHRTLLDSMLQDPYFSLSPPKSTGREYFNLAWLELFLQGATILPVDIETTLAELTAQTIISSIKAYFTEGDILVCGGGAHNAFLMSRLKLLAGDRFIVDTTDQHKIDPDWVEAVAFAWLARQTLNQAPGNLPSVTGAHQPVILGGIYY